MSANVSMKVTVAAELFSDLRISSAWKKTKSGSGWDLKFSNL